MSYANVVRFSSSAAPPGTETAKRASLPSFGMLPFSASADDAALNAPVRRVPPSHASSSPSFLRGPHPADFSRGRQSPHDSDDCASRRADSRPRTHSSTSVHTSSASVTSDDSSRLAAPDPALFQFSVHHTAAPPSLPVLAAECGLRVAVLAQAAWWTIPSYKQLEKTLVSLLSDHTPPHLRLTQPETIFLGIAQCAAQTRPDSNPTPKQLRQCTNLLLALDYPLTGSASDWHGLQAALSRVAASLAQRAQPQAGSSPTPTALPVLPTPSAPPCLSPPWLPPPAFADVLPGVSAHTLVRRIWLHGGANGLAITARSADFLRALQLDDSPAHPGASPSTASLLLSLFLLSDTPSNRDAFPVSVISLTIQRSFTARSLPEPLPSWNSDSVIIVLWGMLNQAFQDFCHGSPTYGLAFRAIAPSIQRIFHWDYPHSRSVPSPPQAPDPLRPRSVSPGVTAFSSSPRRGVRRTHAVAIAA